MITARTLLTLAVLVAISVVLVETRQSSARKLKSPSTVFTNTTTITINTTSGVFAPTTASTYPSTVNVTGMTGTITKVEVTLKGVSHVLGQMDFLLVSPSGAKYIFLSDSNAAGTPDGFYTFSDTGATTLLQPNPSVSGTYLPTDLTTGLDAFPVPAPAGPYSLPPSATFASVFNGTDPNGTWNLYAVDDTLFTPGAIISGWSLNVTTNGAPQTFSNPNYFSFNDITSPATPYGSTINVAGQTGVISNLTVTLTGYSHALPGDVDVLLVSPNGKSLVLMSDIFSPAVSSINLTFDDAAVANLPNPIVSGAYKPTDNQVETDFFPSPAPLRPYHEFNSALSNFSGFNPNGEWRLIITDDLQNNAGSISGGWSLDITTVPAPPQPPLSCSGPTFNGSSFQTGVNPTNLAIADFNNDSKADVAVTNQVSNDVSILLGNGNGTFATQTLIAAGSGPYAIVAGKFNGDNNFDLAVANSSSNNVSILLGNGNGTFGAPANFFVGPSPISIASADFNNDAKLDLAVANFGGFFSGSVSILLGNGSGGFTTGNTVRTRTQPAFVTTGNFNGDGNQDLIVANFGANSVSTFGGNGTETFQLIQNLTTGSGPVAIEYANLDTDAFPDLAIANYNSDTITTCSGNSNGIFTGCNSNSTLGQNPISVTSADYVGNGTRAIATALSGTNSVSVFGNLISVGLNPNAVKSIDLNSDGKPDMITVNSGSNDLSVLINSCSAAKGNLFDYDGDRKTDYSVFRPSNTSYYIQSLFSGGAFTSFGRPNDTLVPADFTGDRRTDFAFYRPESGLWFVFDRFSAPIYFLQFGLPEDIPVPADFDGDGRADIAIFRPSNGTWYIRRSTDTVLQISQFGMSGDKPVAADFDGDDKDDLAIFRPSTGVWYILKSSDGQVIIHQFGISEDRTVAGDYDGDGKADIAVWRPSSGAWYILRSSDGDFRAVAWGMTTDFPVIGDFDGDGKFDYAVWRPSDRTWYIQKSSDGGATFFQWGVPTDIPIPNAFVR